MIRKSAAALLGPPRLSHSTTQAAYSSRDLRMRRTDILTSARLGASVLAIGLVAFSGCGNADSKQPVNGSVTIGGKPASAAMLIFCPVGGSPEFQKLRPMGVTKEDGTF